MNKEVKEILEDLELCNGFFDFILEPEKSEILVDYIKQLQQENKQLKDNQVRALNKIRDFINNANCEIREGRYSNDKHGLYWELFRKDLTNISKLIKGINADEYVNIPKYREEELLNSEDNWNKLKECLKDVMNSTDDDDDKDFVETILDIMQELEQGSGDDE